MYPFDLKNAGATHAEMLPLKNNDAGECVCFLIVMISHGWPAQSCPVAVLSFFRYSAFFFLFYNAFGLVRFSSYKDQC